MLGKNVLKAPSGKSNTERISRTARLKMSEYYHDLLWQNVGSMAEKTLLWNELQGYVYLPYALQHPRLSLGLSNILQDNLYAQFGGSSH